MTTFYLYDGQNEAGPFTLDELKQKRITRITPLRENNSDKWQPAEKISGLKEYVMPRKIKRPKDVVPAVAEHLTYMHYRRPTALYGTLLGIAMLSGFSFYSMGKSKAQKAEQLAQAATQPESVKSSASATALTPEEITPKLQIKAPTASAKDDAARAARLRWNKLISATNSNYGIGFLGGIKDLSVIVHNRSDYPLDQVVAKVTYIKASGEVWKVKPITLYAVAAGESKEEALPDVARCKKVKVTLSKVVSSKMKFSYTEGKRGSDASDPYYKE